MKIGMRIAMAAALLAVLVGGILSWRTLDQKSERVRESWGHMVKIYQTREEAAVKLVGALEDAGYADERQIARIQALHERVSADVPGGKPWSGAARRASYKADQEELGRELWKTMSSLESDPKDAVASLHEATRMRLLSFDHRIKVLGELYELSATDYNSAFNSAPLRVYGRLLGYKRVTSL